MVERDEHARTGTDAGAGAGVGAGGDWRHGAACRGVDPEVFFPTAETGPARAVQVAAAKAVCAGCPVVAECLTWALADLPIGVAGGQDEDERRAVRAAGRPARHVGVGAR